MNFSWDTPLQSLLLTTALGVSLLGTAFLVLGAVGGFTRPAMAALLALTALSARADLATLPEVLRTCARHVRDAAWTSALIVLLVVTLVILVLAVAPPVDYDSLMYHLDVPQDFLRAGRIYLPIDNLHVAQVGLLHMLYVPLLAFVGASAPAVLIGCLTVLLGLATFELGHRFFSREIANISLITLWGSPVLVLVASTAKVDAALPYFLLLSLFVLMAAEEGRDRSNFGIAGALLGFSIGIKLFALPFALACAPLVAWQAWRLARDRRAFWTRLILYWGAALQAPSPWLVKNAVLLGAPLYPLFATPQPEPWLAEIYGGRANIPVVGESARQALEFARSSFNLKDLLIAPEHLTPEVQGRFYTLSPFFLLLPLAALVLVNGRFAQLFCVGCLYLMLIASRGHINLRYLVPAFPPLTVAASALYARTLPVLMRAPGRKHAVVTVGVALLSLLPAAFGAAYQVRFTGVWHVTSGMASRGDFLRYGGIVEVVDYSRLVDSLNRRLTSTDRVLGLFEGKGFYLGDRVVQDNVLTNWPMLSYSTRLDDCLGGSGFTHILFADGAFDYYARRGLDLRLVRWETFQSFRARCLIPTLKVEGYTLYTIRNKPVEPPDTVEQSPK
jgi:hypothetical protein